MKKRSIFLGIGLLVFLSGCSSYDDFDKNIIKIGKDDTISETIRESFEESYYVEEELLSSIEEEVSSYNEDSGSELVELKKCSVDEQTATVQMEYSSSEDYALFNHVGLFHGTVSDFKETEYYTDVPLKDTEGDQVSWDSFASEEGYYVVALDMDCIVEIKGTICYVSDSAETISKKAADITMNDEAYAYIIYK